MNEKNNFNVIEEYKNNDTETMTQYITNIVDSLIVREFLKSLE